MKKSKYEADRRLYWRERGERLWTSVGLDGGELLEELVENHVRTDVAAAEAAGVVWDPEEEPLPERLEVTPNKAYMRIATPERDQSFLAIIDGYGRWDSCFAPKDEVLTILTEAVRRYNLFPRIVAALSRTGEFSYGQIVAEALRIAEEEG